MSVHPFLALTSVLLLIPLASFAAKAPAPAYRGAIVVDAGSGKVLIEDHADFVNPPASVTKLMTFLIVHDRIAAGSLSLSTEVTIAREDANIGGTQVWLEAGEKFTVDDLLYAMLIQSANDCAHALARTVGGSREAFITLMNERAKALGMSRTTFRTPHGLPPSNRKIADGDLTTPRDLAVLSRELLLKTDILRYTTVKERKFRPGQPAPREIIMRSHNHLIGRVRGVDGLKTGFTNGAGYCLAATAERDGRRVIAVVMGSPDQKTRDIKVAELVERGFALLPADSRFVADTSPLRPAASTRTPAPQSSTPSPFVSPAGTTPSRPQTVAPSAADEPGPTVRFVPRR
ncbi:MAG: D-alanyl-D-alanine carboxypeptidase [Opitutaceae bacterium]|nr:D-alanyl-D-alanine carboxypeptidase [Opitutaceae bacterium]